MSSSTKPDVICTLGELADVTIPPYGWVLLNRNVDGMGGVGIKHLGGVDPLARIETLEGAAQFKRNVIIHDNDNFVGRWVAVPEEDFNALRAALAAEETPTNQEDEDDRRN